MKNSEKEEKRLTLHVMIEGGRSFTLEFGVKQKIQVLINKTLENFNLADSAGRKLVRGDNSEIADFKLTAEEVGLRDEETIRFLLQSAPKPDEPKKFA